MVYAFRYVSVVGVCLQVRQPRWLYAFSYVSGYFACLQVCVYLGQNVLDLTGTSADILRVCKCVCACMCVFRPERACSHRYVSGYFACLQVCMCLYVCI